MLLLSLSCSDLSRLKKLLPPVPSREKANTATGTQTPMTIGTHPHPASEDQVKRDATAHPRKDTHHHLVRDMIAQAAKAKRVAAAEISVRLYVLTVESMVKARVSTREC